jgi:hypothetical protein
MRHRRRPRFLTMTKKVVFLDRESLDATVREFNFPHEYKEYESTWTPRGSHRDQLQVGKLLQRVGAHRHLVDHRDLGALKTVREFNFPHEYKEYESTWTPEEIVERLQGAEIAMINKRPRARARC